MDEAGSIAWQNIGLVLLGAGRAMRFGADKLGQPLGGETVLERTARIYAALPLARRIAVVTAGRGALAGYDLACPAEGDLPQSASLALGVRSLGPAGLDGIMVALADMPLITAAHLEALRRAFDGKHAVCSAADGAGDGPRCPPAIFAPAQYEALMGQSGDRGARGLLVHAALVRASAAELLDIDRPEDLARAAERLRAAP